MMSSLVLLVAVMVTIVTVYFVCRPSRRLRPSRESKVHFITYGDERFKVSREALLQEARDTGWFETVRAYTPNDILPELREKYASILQEQQGGGFWVWKPLIIQQALSAMQEGDILVYADAGCRLNPATAARRRFLEYVDMLQSQKELDVLSFQLEDEHVEDRWTTEAIFQHFGVPPGAKERKSPQLVGGVRLIRRGPHARRWLARVLGALEADPWLFSDRYNTDGTPPHFQDNRHDQSIMSLASKLEGSVVLADETYPPNQDRFPIWASRIRH